MENNRKMCSKWCPTGAHLAPQSGTNLQKSLPKSAPRPLRRGRQKNMRKKRPSRATKLGKLSSRVHGSSIFKVSQVLVLAGFGRRWASLLASFSTSLGLRALTGAQKMPLKKHTKSQLRKIYVLDGKWAKKASQNGLSKMR